MGLGSSSYKNIVDTTPVAIDCRTLRRVVVNTGAAGGTVTVTDSAENGVAIIDAANPDIGRRYDAGVDGLIVTLSDAALDVTVTYD